MMRYLIASKQLRFLKIHRSYLKTAAGVATVALLMFSSVNSNAQIANGTEDASYTGPTSAACAHVEALPAAVQKYFADIFIATTQGKPAPPSSPDALAQYGVWQQKNQLQDFGGNCRYEAANAVLPSPAPHRVVFFGDSITELWGVLDPKFFTPDVINRGVSGQTTAQMLVRFRQDVLDLHPETVHILAGVNDIAGNTGPTTMKRIEANMMSMIEQAQAQHIRVIVGFLTPSAKMSWKPFVTPIPFIHEYNTWLKQYASEKHFETIDYFSALVDERQGIRSSLSADGLHPNQAGYAIMSPLALKAIQSKK